MKSNKSECIKVAVRVRPMNQKKEDEQSTICVEVNNATNSVSVKCYKTEIRNEDFSI